MLIAFEGLDQSGKETQARQLRARLQNDGRGVRPASLPDYVTAIGRELRLAPSRERDFVPECMRLLSVADRAAHQPRRD